QLIGDLTPRELATLGAARDLGEATDINDPLAKVPVAGKQIGAKDVLHVISQEVRRLSYFSNIGSVGTRGLKDKEKERRFRDRKVQQSQGQNWGGSWQVRLVNVPLADGTKILVTYGELNTLADYFGSVDEMKRVDPTWLDR